MKNDNATEEGLYRSGGNGLRLGSEDGAIVPDPEGIITGGHDNKAARAISFRQGETINAPALTTMLKQIIANNRAGGWRKLKKP